MGEGGQNKGHLVEPVRGGAALDTKESIARMRCSNFGSWTWDVAGRPMIWGPAQSNPVSRVLRLHILNSCGSGFRSSLEIARQSASWPAWHLVETLRMFVTWMGQGVSGDNLLTYLLPLAAGAKQQTRPLAWPSCPRLLAKHREQQMLWSRNQGDSEVPALCPCSPASLPAHWISAVADICFRCDSSPGGEEKKGALRSP